MPRTGRRTCYCCTRCQSNLPWLHRRKRHRCHREPLPWQQPAPCCPPYTAAYGGGPTGSNVGAYTEAAPAAQQSFLPPYLQQAAAPAPALHYPPVQPQPQTPLYGRTAQQQVPAYAQHQVPAYAQQQAPAYARQQVPTYAQQQAPSYAAQAPPYAQPSGTPHPQPGANPYQQAAQAAMPLPFLQQAPAPSPQHSFSAPPYAVAAPAAAAAYTGYGGYAAAGYAAPSPLQQQQQHGGGDPGLDDMMASLLGEA